MGFIANFWAAYVPVGIVLLAAIVELVTDASKRRTPRPSLDKLESAGNVIVLSPTRPRFLSLRHRASLGAVAARP